MAYAFTLRKHHIMGSGREQCSIPVHRCCAVNRVPKANCITILRLRSIIYSAFRSVTSATVPGFPQAITHDMFHTYHPTCISILIIFFFFSLSLPDEPKNELLEYFIFQRQIMSTQHRKIEHVYFYSYIIFFILYFRSRELLLSS